MKKQEQKTLTEARLRWRDYTHSAVADGYKVAIISTYTAEPFVPYLGSNLLNVGIAPVIKLHQYHNPFANTIQEEVRGFDCIILLLMIEDVVHLEMRECANGHEGARDKAMEKIREFWSGVKRFKAFHGKPVYVSNFTTPVIPDYNMLSIDGGDSSVFEDICNTFNKAARESGFNVLSAQEVERYIGVSRSIDIKRWYLYKQPYSEEFFFELSQMATRMIAASLRSSSKCIVVDADNTLWGGGSR